MRRRLSLAAIAAVAVLACSGLAALSEEPFAFVQLADIQLGFTNANGDLSVEADNFRLAVEQVNRLKPAFVLMTGDQRNEAQNTRQIRLFWQITRDIDPSIPVYIVPGNHDLAGVSESGIRRYERFFGPSYYSFITHGTRFIVLNSTLIKQEPSGVPARAQWDWFAREIGQRRIGNISRTVVVTHHPWFIKSANEPDEYFNIQPPVRKQWLDLMREAGVELAIAGHRHTGSTATDGGLTMVVAGSVGKTLGTDPVGYMVYTVEDGKVTHRFVPLR